MLRILIFLGTTRQGNMSQHVAKLVTETAQAHPQLEAELITSQTYDLALTNEGTGNGPQELTDKIKTADGFILVTPEYNHGYPGTLKFLLDLNLKEYIHKPVAMVGVSSGPFGGTRVIEALLPVVRELGLVATFNDVNVTNVPKLLNSDGSFKDPETWQRRINRLLEELVWMATTLKHGRESVPSKHHQKT